MANIRFIHDFASDSATLTASTTAGSLAPANMQRNEKAAVWRSTATTATITAIWPDAVEVDSFAIGGTNLTSDATITIRLFALADDASPALVVSASTDADFGAAVSQAQAWFSKTAIEKAEVEFSDGGNPDGFVEISRLAIGLRHEMGYNPNGVTLGFVDRSKSSRAESGDVRAELRSGYRTLTLDFEAFEQPDAEILLRLSMRDKSAPLFISLFPDSSGWKRAAHSFFAVISDGAKLGYPMLNMWSTGAALEEM